DDIALLPNIDVHNLRIVLDALTRWNDKLAVGYYQSPFNKDVQATTITTRFKLPTMNTFDRKANPQDHMDHFNDLIELL
ncbi:hypothetical protein PanWU01x14_038820, partial [Parasponia andersonii]